MEEGRKLNRDLEDRPKKSWSKAATSLQQSLKQRSKAIKLKNNLFKANYSLCSSTKLNQ